MLALQIALFSFPELKIVFMYHCITLSKVAAIKFLTEEGVAYEIEDDPWYNVEIPNFTSTVCKKFLGEGGGGKGISKSRLVHILHDDIKICVDPQIQRRLGLFPNVTFLSHNFILTICIASPTWFFIKYKDIPLNLIKQSHLAYFLE